MSFVQLIKEGLVWVWLLLSFFIELPTSGPIKDMFPEQTPSLPAFIDMVPLTYGYHNEEYYQITYRWSLTIDCRHRCLWYRSNCSQRWRTSESRSSMFGRTISSTPYQNLRHLHVTYTGLNLSVGTFVTINIIISSSFSVDQFDEFKSNVRILTRRENRKCQMAIKFDILLFWC